MRRTSWILLAIIVLATLLRFYRLDAQSFWNDEGNSARLSERTLQSITVGTASDIHPPLYYYALHFWQAVFGQSEFALRSFSALCGLSLVGLIYLLGQKLFDEQVGLVSALIAAANPFQIYYSQEARMYTMLAVWAVLATYCVLRISRITYHVSRITYHVSLLYVLASAAGLYTQYAFAFMLLVHNLIVLIGLILWPEGWPRRALAWAAMQVAVVVLYLPWLQVAISRTGGWGVEPDPYTLGSALPNVGRTFAYGVTLPTSQAIVGLAATGVFVLAGMKFGSKGEAMRVGALALWWLVPAGLMFGFELYREVYFKFLLMSSPPACLLAARGIVNAWRGGFDNPLQTRCPNAYALALRPIVLVLVVLAAWPLPRSLWNLYLDPAYARDDYRGVARFVRSVERPGDAMLLIAPNQWEVFTYYYPDADRVYPLARERLPDPAAVDVELREIVARHSEMARHSRLFVLYWGDVEADPHRVYESWLGAHTYKASETWWGKVRLAVYAVPQPVTDTPQQSLDVRFGESIALTGYTLLTPWAVAGDVVQLALFWQASTPIEERYKVFLHVLDGAGQIVAQVDREPGANLQPTAIWQPGQVIVDRYGILMPANISPGRYTLSVGLYSFDGKRLPITQGDQGDALELAEVEIE